MTRTIRILGAVAATGGAAWFIKFLVIAATDGAETGAADAAAAVLYLLGVALMCVGAACVTLRVARGRGRVAIAAAVVAAPLLGFLSYALVDAIVKPAVGDAGPSWLPDEAGIAVTGLLWLAIGLVSRPPGRLAVDRPARLQGGASTPR